MPTRSNILLPTSWRRVIHALWAIASLATLAVPPRAVAQQVSVSITWPGRNADAFHAADDRLAPIQPTVWLGSLLEGRSDPTGLVYMRNRFYDSKSGRFTQEDPIGLGGGKNLYGFVGGDPVNYSDPFGLCCVPGFGSMGYPRVVNDWTRRITAQAWHDGPGAFYAEVASFGMALSAAPLGFAGGQSQETGLSAAGGRLAANAARGRAFEDAVAAEMSADGYSVSREITLQTPGGARTRMDIIATRAGASPRCIECKSSASAALTAGQRAAHPQIAGQGATVMGKGKPAVPGGTVLQPTSVEVRRP